MGLFRDNVKARFSSLNDRRRFWENVLEGPIVERVFAGRQAEAESMLVAAIEKGGVDSRNSAGLISHGRAPDTPVAIVSRGSSADQQVLIGTLSDIAEKQQQQQLPAPALLIVGNVVRLHEKLAWFGDTEPSNNITHALGMVRSVTGAEENKV